MEEEPAKILPLPLPPGSNVIDIKPHDPEPKPGSGPTATINIEQEEQQVMRSPFFFNSRYRSRRRHSDTWAVSVFFILHLLAFIVTAVSNGDSAVVGPFQPLSENPLLGPSASTLDKVGAIRRTLLAQHQTYRLFFSPLLHAGLIHLIINLTTVIFIGTYLEQEFEPLRVGVIYTLSAFVGTLLAALLVRDSPVVTSSGGLFGLLGATISALIRNWEIYMKKVVATLVLLLLFTCNFMLGLLPYVDNYSSIGGFVSGVLLGFLLLFTPQRMILPQNKSGLYEHKMKWSFSLKQNFDQPVLRIVSLVLFTLMFAGLLAAVLQGINISQKCKWCGYIDCIPSKMWSCGDLTSACEDLKSGAETTLTCSRNGNFRIFPYTEMSAARKRDLCTLICS